MKRRQANKIVRKSAETDLRWKKITIFNAYQNATDRVYLTSARKWFDRLATAAALIHHSLVVSIGELAQLKRQKDNKC
jgi:predicted kinase